MNILKLILSIYPSVLSSIAVAKLFSISEIQKQIYLQNQEILQKLPENIPVTVEIVDAVDFTVNSEVLTSNNNVYYIAGLLGSALLTGLAIYFFYNSGSGNSGSGPNFDPSPSSSILQKIEKKVEDQVDELVKVSSDVVTMTKEDVSELIESCVNKIRVSAASTRDSVLQDLNGTLNTDLNTKMSEFNSNFDERLGVIQQDYNSKFSISSADLDHSLAAIKNCIKENKTFCANNNNNVEDSLGFITKAIKEGQTTFSQHSSEILKNSNEIVGINDKLPTFCKVLNQIGEGVMTNGKNVSLLQDNIKANRVDININREDIDKLIEAVNELIKSSNG